MLKPQFLARYMGDKLAERHTQADGVIGHVRVGGDETLTNITLRPDATQFIVTEAKLFAPLKKGVKALPNFDQAARSVACMAQVLSNAHRLPRDFSSLGFFVLAPRQKIDARKFSPALSLYSVPEEGLGARVAIQISRSRERRMAQTRGMVPNLVLANFGTCQD